MKCFSGLHLRKCDFETVSRGVQFGSEIFPEMKIRLDKLLVERGLVTSRERGQSLILAGRVLVNEQKVEKAGAAVEQDAEVSFLGTELKYVSRGD